MTRRIALLLVVLCGLASVAMADEKPRTLSALVGRLLGIKKTQPAAEARSATRRPPLASGLRRSEKPAAAAETAPAPPAIKTAWLIPPPASSGDQPAAELSTAVSASIRARRASQLGRDAAAPSVVESAVLVREVRAPAALLGDGPIISAPAAAEQAASSPPREARPELVAQEPGELDPSSRADAEPLPPVFQRVRGRVRRVDAGDGTVLLALHQETTLPQGSEVQVLHRTEKGQVLPAVLQVIQSEPGVATARFVDDQPRVEIQPGDEALAWKDWSSEPN